MLDHCCDSDCESDPRPSPAGVPRATGLDSSAPRDRGCVPTIAVDRGCRAVCTRPTIRHDDIVDTKETLRRVNVCMVGRQDPQCHCRHHDGIQTSRKQDVDIVGVKE